jgi:hypothetical protein
MADPQTSNLGFYVPTRGSDSGTWDSPVNANSSAQDSMFANVATLSLSNANVTLSTPPNSGAAWSGPYQSQSALIKCTGVISANITITIPRAGYFIFWNLCTIASGAPAGSTGFYILVGSAAPGKLIGLPPGEMCHAFCDGVDLNYVNMGRVGSALDLHGVQTVPTWIAACTFLPFLLKDGTNYTNAAFPTLAGVIGTKFGGTPGLNFNVPDERERARIAYDPGAATGRLSSVIGDGMGDHGGDQFLQSHNHGASVSDPQHSHNVSVPRLVGANTGGAGNSNLLGSATSASVTTDPASTGIGVNISSFGSGGSQNVQPSIISFLPLIKT